MQAVLARVGCITRVVPPGGLPPTAPPRRQKAAAGPPARAGIGRSVVATEFKQMNERHEEYEELELHEDGPATLAERLADQGQACLAVRVPCNDLFPTYRDALDRFRSLGFDPEGVLVRTGAGLWEFRLTAADTEGPTQSREWGYGIAYDTAPLRQEEFSDEEATALFQGLRDVARPFAASERALSYFGAGAC